MGGGESRADDVQFIAMVRVLFVILGVLPLLALCEPVSSFDVSEMILDSPDRAWNSSLATIRRKRRSLEGKGVHPVTEKKLLPPSGDRHDYMSIGLYWWPDPAKKDGKPYIRKDGVPNPAYYDMDPSRLQGLCQSVMWLAAAAWRLGDVEAGREAARRLRVFFLDEETRMNPNLNFGQGIPGLCDGRGFGIIDTYSMVGNGFIESLKLLRRLDCLDDSLYGGLQHWFSQYLEWLENSKHGQEESIAKNNHGTAYDLQRIAFADFCGNREHALEILREAPARRIDGRITAEGLQPLEAERASGLSYSLYNLKMYCELAYYGERYGVDIWNYVSPEGANIRKAIEFVLPFCKGARKWPYQENAKVDERSLRFCELAMAHFENSAPVGANGMPGVDEVSSVVRRISEQFLSTEPEAYCPKGFSGVNGYPERGQFGRFVHYSTVILWTYAMECARLSRDADLERRLVAKFAPFHSSKNKLLPKFKHVDFSVFGAVPLEVAILTANEESRELGLKLADGQWEQPKKDDAPPSYNAKPFEERMEWWRLGYSDQTRLWIDDAYMISLLQTQAYRATNDAKYLNRSAQELSLYLDRIQLENGLFHHATNSPFCWGRGNGWMAGAMSIVLTYLPKSHALRPRILEGFRKMCRTLRRYQRPDGLWGQLVDDGASWPETSCSAMFAAAFANGAKRGWLDAEYGTAAAKAWRALVGKMDTYGNLPDTCCGTAAGKDRPYYLKRPRIKGDPHGQAAMLWLAAAFLEDEERRVITLPLPHDDLVKSKFELVNRKADGFRGLWYYNQKTRDEYAFKYSGGMGVYCAGHVPFAVHSPEARKTFFCYGGTDGRNSTSLHCVSYFDHATGLVARPTIVLDKHTTDAHDNPVINLDDRGYIYIFSSSHGRQRPSCISRSVRPYDISEFKVIWSGNFSYPQPWFAKDRGFVFLETIYATGMSDRQNCFSTSDLQVGSWSKPQLLAFINDGDYQRSWQSEDGSTVGIVFDQHPKGRGKPSLNWRTDVFYMETRDAGKTWQTAGGEVLALPLRNRENPALVHRYAERNLNVYLKGVRFDSRNRPIVTYTVSKGYKPGPANGPRRWMLSKWTGREWIEVDTGIVSGNNYDFYNLYLDTDTSWRLVGASGCGPQPGNPGGEIEVWSSADAGVSWKKSATLTRNSVRNQNYPRQPLHAHPDFYSFWADGDGRHASVSRLYFCNRDLQVFRLPFSFSGDFVRPEKLEFIQR